MLKLRRCFASHQAREQPYFHLKAFLAADADESIGMLTVMAAMAREYAKLGRLRTIDEFGPYLDVGR